MVKLRIVMRTVNIMTQYKQITFKKYLPCIVNLLTQYTFTCLKSTIETLEKDVKYVHS